MTHRATNKIINEVLQEVFRHGYEFHNEFPEEDISKITDSCIAEHQQRIIQAMTQVVPKKDKKNKRVCSDKVTPKHVHNMMHTDKIVVRYYSGERRLEKIVFSPETLHEYLQHFIQDGAHKKVKKS